MIWFLLAGLMLPCVLCPHRGVRSKMSECKSNLRAWATAERSFKQETDRYSPVLREIGFAPERGNRYGYYVFGLSGTAEDRSTSEIRAHPGDTGIDPDVFKYGEGQRLSENRALGAFLVADPPPARPGEITAFCVGRIADNQPLDVWSISTGERGETPAEVPLHHTDALDPYPRPQLPIVVLFAVAALAYAPFAIYGCAGCSRRRSNSSSTR